MSGNHKASDKNSAFTGLIFGVVAIAVILFATVKLTNAHYASEKAEATAGASK